MFHGPQFQGVTELDAIGPRHIRGTIATPAAPGALLDNAGQLLGAWMMSTHGSGEVVFPVGLQSLRLFGAHPPAGARVQCTVRVRSVADDILEADMQLVHDGRVWAQIEGWQDRRFTVDAAVGRCPETTMLSRAHAGGWTVVSDAWTDLASRELIARGQLSALERADYERCSPRARRQWLLGRIAVKDAVRRLLSGEGSRPLFPAEIRVFNDHSGAPRVAGLHGAQLGELAVSLAHCRDVAVGIAARRPTGVGIDVEEIADRGEAVGDVALSAAETALLRARAGQADEDDAFWLIRFWTAKEAVAKAEGTGLAGLPRRFEVVAASPTELTVRVHAKDGDGRTYRVRCEQLRDPPRDYVVAWTTDPEPDHEEMP
jgi:phosphopantetheinyl transferase